jgi:alkyl sulfatase BDS1-like metallo-beta-lactamase superfamily hydrolase
VDDVLALADRLWRGEVRTADLHPLGPMDGLAEIGDGIAFVPAFANVTAVATDAGLVLVDTGSSFAADSIHDRLRRWNGQRLHTAIYSHGHIDHVFGVGVWEAEAERNGWPAPVVVAHEGVPARFRRYVMTAGYNAVINRRQFGVANLRWPTEYRYPDRVYSSELAVDVGGVVFALRHEKGETDDHTVTWLPGPKVLCCGDLFIWASPNAGNPQKVQRYPLEWAQALRRMAALEPECLLPGHGLPVLGRERVAQALADTADLLESLVAQTIDIMNAGGRLDDAVHSVTVPPGLASRPYLQPVYDEPEFIVRTVWRRYGGWWDGNPATLKPARERALAAEIARLAGGAAALAARAVELAGQATAGEDSGRAPQGAAGDQAAEENLRLAGHLAELAWLADPTDPQAREAKRQVFTLRMDRATSTMAKGVFRWAAREAGGPTVEDSS